MRATPDDDRPRSRRHHGEGEQPLIADEAAAEAATEDLEERTATLPDPDPQRRWFSWWQAQGEAELSALLRTEWNPLGGDDVPADEYAAYANRLGDLLREGIGEDEVSSFLSDTRTGALGLAASEDEDRRTAAVVHAWYRTAHRAAE